MNIYMLTCSHTNTCTSILTHVHLYSHTCACSTYIYTCACSQIHTYTPAHVHIHTYILYLYRSLYLKARPLITIWNGLVFLCFLRAKLSEFITHFSIFAAAMPAHIPGIFSVQEMHVLMKCHCSLILFSVSRKPSIPSFPQPGSFWGLMKRNDAILRENLSACSLCLWSWRTGFALIYQHSPHTPVALLTLRD